MVPTSAVTRFALVATLAASLALISATGQAQDESARREARDLANRGYEKFKRGEYDEAIALLQQAEDISHSPVILSFIAQSYEKLGRLIEAQRQYAAVVNEALADDAPEDFVKAQRQARRQVLILARRIPRIVLRISGVPPEAVKVSLDGRPVAADRLGKPIRVNPGSRRLVLDVEGQERVERTITATERQVTDVDLVLATRVVERQVPGPAVRVAPASDDGWIGPVVGYGVGLAGLTLGLTAGAIYLDRRSSLRERCPDNRCAPELEGERDTLSALGVASVVGLGLGVAGAAVGTVLLIVDDGDATPGDARATVALGAGPSGLWLQGAF